MCRYGLADELDYELTMIDANEVIAEKPYSPRRCYASKPTLKILNGPPKRLQNCPQEYTN
jgi:hypothetical protein